MTWLSRWGVAPTCAVPLLGIQGKAFVTGAVEAAHRIVAGAMCA